MNAVPALPVVERLRVILSGLRTYVGLRAYYVFGYDVRLMALCMDGLTRRGQRFFRLVAAIEAGTLRPIRPRAPRPAGSSPRAQQRGGPSFRLPSRYGWLRLALEQSLGAKFDDGELADLVQAYEALLDAPELRRLYDLAPDRMGRLLRPMLHVCGRRPPDWLRLPRRKRAVRTETGHCEPRRGAASQEHRPKPPSTPEPPSQPKPPSTPRPRRCRPKPSPVPIMADDMSVEDAILEARRQFRRTFIAKHGFFPLVRFQGEEL